MSHRFEEVLKKSGSAENFSKCYLEHLSVLIKNLDLRSINTVIEVLETARKNKKKIFIMGNGGSAATASHLAEDLALGPHKRGQVAFRTISLTDNPSLITAVANDEGHDLVFLRQLEILLENEDVVIGISASGNSPNVLRALEYVNEHAGVTIGFSGFDGGKMKKICQYCVHVATEPGDYEPVEDIHLVIGHLIASFFKYRPRSA